MARKFLGALQVLETRVGGNVPPGRIDVKLRQAGGAPFWARLSLAEYSKQVVLKPAASAMPDCPPATSP
jgi:hypothetical protein